jgi:hypothetical protein
MWDLKSARSQDPIAISRMTLHIAERLERMKAPLRRGFWNPNHHRNLPERQHPPRAKCLKHSNHLMRRAVE